MKRVVIFGAGVAGQDIQKEISINPHLKISLVGFLDDDPKKHNLRINRAKVLGGRDQLKKIVRLYRVDQVIIAIPSAIGEQIAEIIKLCSDAKVSFLIVPRVKEIIEGKAHLRTLRKVRVEDLLGRPVIKADIAELRNFLRGARVLITGAAGSIGSEVARQVAAYQHLADVTRGNKLMLVDWWENGLFELLGELKENFPYYRVGYAIANIQDLLRMNKIFARFKPDLIFHAAAYKHVPLMEDNIVEAVKNNVFGTLNVAKLAKQFKIDRFVMISTDKAAEPVNVMGMTKLIAEAIVKSLNGETKYLTVRFGNVLDSFGSVVPLFRKQIEEGGPVTITDKRMTRYFMTIPEAAQLILKSALLGQGGELFVLDMGQPVKIIELARNLIRLSGFVPGKDIKIVYTGIRPGEKLEERLFNENEKLLPTKEERIFVTTSEGLGDSKIRTVVKELRELVKRQDSAGIRSKFHQFKSSFPK